MYSKNEKKENEKHSKDQFVSLNDYELNRLPYINALIYDKRGFFDIYKSLLIEKHQLIFSFYPMIDYNSIVVKIDLFFLSINIYHFINALFFNESTIHKIYEDKGAYNFGYFFPQIFYSFIISYLLCYVIKYFSLSHKDIYKIKLESSHRKALNRSDKVKRVIVIKYFLFYIIGLIFLFFLWYYISSFSAVYKNTQIYLITNMIICFCLSLMYQFIINLFPCLFRIISLQDSKREILYKINIVFHYL